MSKRKPTESACDPALAKMVVLRFLDSAPLAKLFKFSLLIEAVGECWFWRGATAVDGYGLFYLGSFQGRPYRMSYEWKTGAPFPKGLIPDHLCRQPGCVNPDHIEPVSHRENILRGNTVPAYNSQKTECLNGHPFDDKNTYRWKNSQGKNSRACRECVRTRNRTLRAARRKPRKQGSQRADARLTERQVRAMRSAHRERDVPMSVLARRYKVSIGNIHKIIHRETWRHVP